MKQVWLFYEKALIIRRKEQHEEAIMLAYAMSLPLGGKDAGEAYKKYLDSLLPSSVKKSVSRMRRGKHRPADELHDPHAAIQNILGVGLPPPPPGKRKKGNKPK